MLRSGETGAGGSLPDEGFSLVGTAEEEEPLTLARTLSYDEMALSALLSVATPTLFINAGDRGNQAKPGRQGSFEEQGVFRRGACRHSVSTRALWSASRVVPAVHETFCIKHGGARRNDSTGGFR